MKLNDLEDGMVITYRNGDKRVVKGDNLYEGEFNTLSMFRQKFNEDLRYIRGTISGEDQLDIIEVEIPSILWKREEVSKEQQEMIAIREQMEELATRLKQLEEGGSVNED